jgi:hypothetical protein
VSDATEYCPPLHDLDLVLFEDANSDDGGGGFVGERRRTILIGTPLTEV